MTTNIIPSEMQSISDEEFAILALVLNDEERERLTALIPEREDDLITE